MSKSGQLKLRAIPKDYCLELLDDTGKNLLKNMPIRRMSFDWGVDGSPILLLEIDTWDWSKEINLEPDQVTFIKRANILEDPEWTVLLNPATLKELLADYGVRAGYEVVSDDGSHHLIGSGEVETDLWETKIKKFRRVFDWDIRLENIIDPPKTPEDLCVSCGHKRIYHRPRLICGRLLNESGPPDYCNCMIFRDGVPL